jgi:hypothetical protein
LRRLLRRRGARPQETRWFVLPPTILSSAPLPPSSTPLPLPPIYIPPTNAPAGVKNYTVSLDTQTADITAESTLDYATVLEKIKKTGKTVNSGEADGVVQAI